MGGGAPPQRCFAHLGADLKLRGHALVAGCCGYIASMDGERDQYWVLQMDPRSEPEFLEAACRRLARKYHPDVSDVADRGHRMKDLNAAYEVLRDPI